ncbi:MAG: alternative ribosome rescue aminoacyl-tRNA hydrolase ArfB [Thermoguttaceae bacterium]
MLKITSKIQIPLEELRFTYVRSSGPGGQNVNKVSSKAVLRWNPAESNILSPETFQRLVKLFPSHCTKEGEVIIASQKTRDALKNKNACLQQLQRMILEALKVPKPRIPTKPTKGSIARRLDDKTKNATKKQNRRRVDFD